MSQKNETTVLILALLITAALLAGGFWWFTKKSGFDLNNSSTSKPNNSSSPSVGASSPATNQSNQSSQSVGEGFAQVQNVPTGRFNYGGSTSFAPIRLSVDSAVQSARPEFRLRYTNPSSGPASSGGGIKMLLDGQIAFAQSSRPILDREYQQAQGRGFNLQQIAVAIDGLAVAVNPNLNIKGLTLGQLKSIYTGQVTNWNQLSGPNVAIKPFSRPVGSGGTVELFVEQILGKQPFGKNVQFVPTTTAALGKIANTTGGIYYASAPEVVPQCSIQPLRLGRQLSELVSPYQEPLVPASQCPGKRNQLNTAAFQSGQYPITRNLFVIVKQNGQIDQQAGEAYANLLLTAQGQELFEKAGFVKIR